MKQTFKLYLYIELIFITLFIIIGICLIPVLFINNVLFAILYFIILPLILLGTFKILVILYNKIDKL